MARSALTALICSALTSLCLFVQVSAQGKPQSALDQPYSLFGTKEAILDRGGIYSRMVGHKTVLLSRDISHAVGEAIASPDENFEAAADLVAKTVKVRKIEWHGKWGQQKDYWQMNGYFELLGLSNDGEHLVAGTRDVYPLPLDYKRDQVMFSFFKTGNCLAQVRLDQLTGDFSTLRRVDRGYWWGRYLGLNRAGHFVVETVEGKKLLFNVETGKTVKLETIGAPSQDWHIYRNIMGAYEFRYPPDFSLRERPGYQETQTGDTTLKREDTGWLIFVSAEEEFRESRDTTPSSFSAFAIDRAKVRCQADGADSTVYADSVLTRRAFRNSQGLEVLEFSLAVVRETYDEDQGGTESEKSIRGPFYVVNLDQPADRSHQALFFEIDHGEKDRHEKRQLVERIVDTVRILK